METLIENVEEVTRRLADNKATIDGLKANIKAVQTSYDEIINTETSGMKTALEKVEAEDAELRKNLLKAWPEDGKTITVPGIAVITKTSYKSVVVANKDNLLKRLFELGASTMAKAVSSFDKKHLGTLIDAEVIDETCATHKESLGIRLKVLGE